jgi:hypothetical protein
MPTADRRRKAAARKRALGLLLSTFCLLPAAFGEGSTQETPDDLFTLWMTCSSTARQNTATDNPLLSGAAGTSASRSGAAPAFAPLIPPADPANLQPQPAPPPADASPTPGWGAQDGKPRQVNQKSEIGWASLTAQVEVTDALQPTFWDDPSWKRAWQTNQSLNLGVAGPFSLFGQLGANSDEASQANMKVSGRTGLACKVPVGPLAEVTVRSGPGVSYTNPLQPVRTTQRSDWLLEVQARWPLLFGIGLEYQGTATPSLTPLQQDSLNQDLRLAFPVGQGGKFKVGARRQWQGSLDQQRTTWTDSTQLYLGLELNR